jgi:hypothetical protein
MKPIQLRFVRSFYVRHGLVGGFVAVLALMIPLVMRHAGVAVWLAPPLLIGPVVFLVRREMRIAARQVDHEGVTRGDGQRFLWKDIQKIQDVHWIRQNGQQGGLNHVDLVFAQGRARILFQVLENGLEAIAFARKKLNPPGECAACGKLGANHFAMQKHGQEGEDTFLPAAVGKLKGVRAVRHPQEGKGHLQQCPDCGAFFFFRNEYEYLATGSEDTQILIRITAEEAEKLPPPK